MQIIRADNKVEEIAATKQTVERVAKEINAKDAKLIEFRRLPLFKDIDSSKWQLVYAAKCRAAAAQIADFQDAKKDVQLKEDKKECLIELIDVLDENDAVDVLTTDKMIDETFKMVSSNLFRTFSNKSKLDPVLKLIRSTRT